MFVLSFKLEKKSKRLGRVFSRALAVELCVNPSEEKSERYSCRALRESFRLEEKSESYSCRALRESFRLEGKSEQKDLEEWFRELWL